FTGLTNGTAYAFKVAAVNALGTGPQSTLSSSVTPVGLPSAASGVSGTAGDTQVSLTWTAPSSDGGTPIVNYQVTVYNSLGGAATTDDAVTVYDASGGPALGRTGATTRSVGSAATAYTFTGLTNGTAYAFKVAAVNAAGTGPQSALSPSVMPGPPDAPTAVK